MKTFGSQITALLRARKLKRNFVFLMKFFIALIALVVFFALAFQQFMLREGHEHSFVTGVYWTLTVMSTLGFGDITFHTDAGRIFSLVVLVTGVVFMLVLLPFLIIEFVYAPLLEAQAASRAPRQLPAGTAGHVLVAGRGPVGAALVDRLKRRGIPYAVVEPDLEQALALHDLGTAVLVGDLDDPETWRAARVERAALVAATLEEDPVNTNVVVTLREVAPRVPVAATAELADSVDILELAGANAVLHLADMTGRALARYPAGGGGKPQPLGRFGRLVIAEMRVQPDGPVGHSLREVALGERFGVNAAGVWRRGKLLPALPDTALEVGDTLIVALSNEQFETVPLALGSARTEGGLALILGGGRVGRAVARHLTARGIDWHIVERSPALCAREPGRATAGDAADIETMRRAGIDRAASVIITPHDDDLNVYLTIYCRKLRPEAAIATRASLERNVQSLHRAGADFVISQASMGANAILNRLHRDDVILLDESLVVRRTSMPPALAGRTLLEAGVRERTGATVVAVETGRGLSVNPDPRAPLPADGRLVLLAESRADDRFVDAFVKRS